MNCPYCSDGIIEDSDKVFKCSNQSSECQDGKWVETGSCTFKVFKGALSRFSGPEITEEFLEELIEKGEVLVDLVSKAGSNYQKYVVLDKKFGTKIDFERNVEE